MNAPSKVAPAHPILAEALARFAGILGDTHWTVPILPFESGRFEEMADRLALPDGERLAAALLYAVEADPGVARAVGQVQAPVAGARCRAGLLATIFAREGLTVSALWSGKAALAGLLVWGDEDVPLPERTVHMPPWLVTALAGDAAAPPGVSDPVQPRVRVPQRAEQEMGRLGRLLVASAPAGRTILLGIRGKF